MHAALHHSHSISTQQHILLSRLSISQNLARNAIMFTTLPLLPPPPSTLLPSSITPYAPSYATESSTNGPTTLAQAQQHQQQQVQQRGRPKPSQPSSRNNTLSLAALSLDERLLEARKRAIAIYGYGWLRPAGCGKTMLGRREEEVEREEVERQLREVEEQEAMALAGEEEARRRSVLARGEVQGEGERDLDEEIPDAEQLTHGEEEENDMVERDMDDDVPDADEGDRTNMTFGNTTMTTELLLEGETGITDDVEGTSLGQPEPAVRSVMAGGGAAFREFDAQEQEALANAMLDEDEQGMAERDLDDEVPSAGEMGERDLDDDVPEPEDEGEWQHTDTEDEQMEEDESGMDISNLDQSAMGRARGVTPGQSSVAMPETSETMGSPGSGRRWFSGGARRNLFGRGAGNLFGLTPPPQQPDSEQLTGPPAAPRRSGRAGRENRGRDSLD
jgi:hypothetical protein